MAGIRLIRRRIKSAKNIAQITRAMQMVAASRMKKAQSAALAQKPYAEKIYQAVSELSQICDTSFHRLLRRQREADKSLIILISTNKGLCGSLNTNLFRKILSWFPKVQEYDFITLGTKGAKFVIRGGYRLVADFSDKTPFGRHVGPIVDIVIDSFLKGDCQQVFLVYNSFRSVLNIEPQAKLILPMAEIKTEENKDKVSTYEFLMEPSPKALLNSLLPHYLETQVLSSLVEAEASEHSSRMLAMKAATDNALTLSLELTLVYNKLRQEQITYEIADITRAQLSLKH